jgi:DNA-binding GntR family transcriptional regulator
MAQSPYEVLLNRILLGEYSPGKNLLERDIAKELGVSRTPVREALLRLQQEGLVRIIPRGGIFVAEASIHLIRAVTEVRLALEEFLAHLVVERRTDTWLDEFQHWLDGVAAIWHDLSPREWMTKDMEFHQLLDKAAGNDVLANHLGLLRRQAVLFWGQSTEGYASLEGIITDFSETLAAIREKDFEGCARVLRRHVLDHVVRIQSYMRPQTLDRSVLHALTSAQSSKD